MAIVVKRDLKNVETFFMFDLTSAFLAYLPVLLASYSLCFVFQVLLSGLIGVVSWKRPLSLVVSVLSAPTLHYSFSIAKQCDDIQAFHCAGGRFSHVTNV